MAGGRRSQSRVEMNGSGERRSDAEVRQKERETRQFKRGKKEWE